MAKKKKTKAPAALTERASPLLGNALLWVGFLVVLTVGIVTVFVPELTDEASDEDGAAVDETASDDTTGDDATADDADSTAAPAAPTP